MRTTRPHRTAASSVMGHVGRRVLSVLGMLVLASTVVAATPAAAAPALPASELTSPAVTSLDPGRVDQFWRTSSGRLAHRYRPDGGSWGRTFDLGGSLRSQPAAVSWGPGRIDVFVRWTDNTLRHRWFANGRWSQWRNRGGTLSAAPAVASSEEGRLDVFTRATNGALRQRTYIAGQGWSPWRRRGGWLTSSPAATSQGPGRLDVIGRSRDRTLLHRWYEDGQWSAWRRIWGGVISQPAIASPGPGELDVLARRQGGGLWNRRRVDDTWERWTSMGGAPTSGPSATSEDQAVIAAIRRRNSFYTTRRNLPGLRWQPWVRVDPREPFRHLGTWVDVFDYAALDPWPTIGDMDARGVRTLFLATARFNSADDVYDADEAGEWLDVAHAAGLKVVGWYLPAYGDMERDVRRTVAIAEFTSPGGQRFDAVGVDIERFDEVSRQEFNVRLVEHLSRVRSATGAMIAAITPSPYTTEPGNNWEGFPWSAVGARSDVVIPMALWSFRDNCPGPERCPFTRDQVYAWVRDQTEQTRALTRRPVHVEGGVDDPGVENTPVTPRRVEYFVNAVLDGGAIGGSHYDYRTTDAALWPILDGLNP
jgi:hypothetical protein